jgi:hypothetical protein
MADEDSRALELYRALERKRPDDPLVRLHRRRLEGGAVGAILPISSEFSEPELNPYLPPTTRL